MENISLQAHMIKTYFYLRIGLALVAIALPFVLWIIGLWIFDLPLQGSMSAYYHAGDGSMRDVFVGVLFAVGAFLILYKGCWPAEDIALDLAGIFLVGVALVPMEWDCGDSCKKFSLHGAFAFIFFLSIAYVVFFRASDTLSLMRNQCMKERYMTTYKILGGLMALSPFIAITLSWFFGRGSENEFWIFFVEAVGVVVFGSYWIVKSKELKLTGFEQHALEGRLKRREFQFGDIFREMPVELDPQGGSPKQ